MAAKGDVGLKPALGHLQMMSTRADLGTGSPAAAATPSPPTACGLANLGNSCYLNSLLQCLASLPPFAEDCKAEATPPGRGYTGTLRECLREMRSGVTGVETVRANKALWRVLQRGGLIDDMANGAQQDADEMLGALCDAMVTERESQPVREGGGVNSASSGLASLLLGGAAALGGGAPLAAAASPAAVERLRGMFASGYACTVCGWKSDVAVTPSWNLPLVWPATAPGQPVRLLDCMRHFSTAELIDGVYCPGCSGTSGLDAANRAVAEGPEGAEGAVALTVGRGGRAAEVEWRARAEVGRERMHRWRQHVVSGDPLTPMPWPPWPTAPPADDREPEKRRCGDLTGRGPGNCNASIAGPQPPEPRAKVEVRKWMSLARPPDCLCLVLKRLQYDSRSGQQYKDTRPVEYPARLDLRPFTSLGEVRNRPASASADGSDDEAQGRYELCGVVMHHGSAFGGHYTAYVRLPRAGGGNVWAHADDERVDIGAREEDVVGSAVAQERAYMLFYCRGGVG